MSKREQGSGAIAALVAVGAMGLTGFYVSNNMRKTNALVNETEELREQEDARLSTMSVLSRFKGLVSERKNAAGQYIPGVYATNYFETKWNLKNANLQNVKKASVPKDGKLTVDALSVKTVDKADEVMRGKTQVDAGFQPLDIKVEPVTFSGPYDAMVENIDVEITGEVLAPDGKSRRKVKNRARVKVPAPTPMGAVLEVSPAGSNAWSTNLTQLENGGNWDFRVKASGVVYMARLFQNDVEIASFGGWDLKTGRMLHKAVSYDAKDEIMGTKTNVPLGGGEVGDVTMSADCKYVPPTPTNGGKFVFRVDLEGVDGKSYKGTDPVEVQVKGEATALGPDPSLDDYRNNCVDENQCPFIEEDWDASQMAAKYEAGYKKDLSSPWARNEAMSSHDDGTGNYVPGYGIGFRKLCFRQIGNTIPFTFINSEMVTYEIPSCKRKFLATRSGCGCVTGDSRVLMGDGKTEKRISEIVDGDWAWNPVTKKAYPIRRITRGPEQNKPMLAIKAGDSIIRATGNHPFLTMDGRTLKAMDLHEGHVLKGAGDKALKVQSVAAEYPGKDAPVVWNLELEAPNYDLEAHNVQINGIVTGDFLIQTMLESGVASN